MNPISKAASNLLLGLLLTVPASGQINIAGIGAISCAGFLKEAEGNTATEKHYFAWAQGYMSGLLIRAPKGVDEDLNLIPPTFPLFKQVTFLRDYCIAHPEHDYVDSVQMLYRTLRSPSG